MDTEQADKLIELIEYQNTTSDSMVFYMEYQQTVSDSMVYYQELTEFHNDVQSWLLGLVYMMIVVILALVIMKNDKGIF